MTNHLTWQLVDTVATELGASESARLKWRQRPAGVPSGWRINIVGELMKRGVPVSLQDFDALPVKPGRIAA
jgi:hypothetical protein